MQTSDSLPQEAKVKLAKLYSSPKYYSRLLLRIKTKDSKVVPLIFNRAQNYLYKLVQNLRLDKYPVRVLVLKARQVGISTGISGIVYHHTVTRQNITSMISSHDIDSSDNIYRMYRMFYDYTDPQFKVMTKYSNRKEILFENPNEDQRDRLPGMNSQISVHTANNTKIGRSFTIHNFHGCLGPDTLIVVPETGRLQKMKRFKVGDLVRTHLGNTAKISFISKTTKSAKKVWLRGLPSTPLIATNEHRFWTKSGWVELEDLCEGDCIGFPIRPVVQKISKANFRQRERKRPQHGGLIEKVPQTIPYSYGLGRLLGLYLAEGVVALQRDGTPASVTFCVHRKEVLQVVRWLTEFKPFFRSYSCSHRKPTKSSFVTVYGRSFASFFLDQCGRTKTKHFPNTAFKAGTSFSLGLVHGYLIGDGHFSSCRDRRIRATSIRSSLTVVCRELLASLGYGGAGIARKRASMRGGRNEKLAYVLSLCGEGVNKLSSECGKPFVKRKRVGRYKITSVCGGYLWSEITKIKEVGKAEVMDFEIDHEDHSYCTLHGATHNSEVAYWSNPQEVMEGVEEATPYLPGTSIFLESTANGMGNYFHRKCEAAMRGKGNYKLVFVPWFWMDEYVVEDRDSRIGKLCSTDKDEFGNEEELVTKFHLSNNQLAWRRMKIETNYEGNVDRFRQEYPSDPHEAFIFSGQPLFHTKTLLGMKDICSPPEQQKSVSWSGSEYSLLDDERGHFKIWVPPQSQRRYAIGADVAEGIEGGDNSVVSVVDVLDLCEVAQWCGLVSPDDLGYIIFHIAHLYNDPLVGVEVNNHGLTTVVKLSELGYWNQYRRETFDAIKKKRSSKYGWKTTMTTKPLMIDELRATLKSGDLKLCCVDTVEEMLTFVKHEDGSLGAQPGKHDDRVIALAIALQMAKQTYVPKVVALKDINAKITFDFLDKMADDLHSQRNRPASMGSWKGAGGYKSWLR